MEKCPKSSPLAKRSNVKLSKGKSSSATMIVPTAVVFSSTWNAWSAKIGVELTNSAAPMSASAIPSPSPSFRAWPVWSCVGAGTLLAASMAGLPGKRGWMKVPFFSVRDPINGLVLNWSLLLVVSPATSSRMLLPSEDIVMVPLVVPTAKLDPLFAKIEFRYSMLVTAPANSAE